jgi:hypothetical protein
MDPTQFLDEKTKEKALTEEMKKKYGTDRGTRGIIIKRINDVTTQMATKIMACKLLRKCPQGGSLGWGRRSCSTMCRGHHS